MMRQGNARTALQNTEAMRQRGGLVLRGELDSITFQDFNSATAQKLTLQGCEDARTQKPDELMLQRGKYTALQRSEASSYEMIVCFCDAKTTYCCHFMTGLSYTMPICKILKAR